MERRDNVEPGSDRNFFEVHQADRRCDDGTCDDTQQHSDVGDETLAPLDQRQYYDQNEQCDGQASDLAEGRVGECRRGAIDNPGERLQATACPIYAHSHQGYANHENDRSCHDGWKHRQKTADERCGEDAEEAGPDHGAVNSQQTDFGGRGHGEHRTHGGECDPHHDRQANADAGKSEALHNCRQTAGEQVRADQECDLVGWKVDCPANDQRDRDGAGIHDKDVLDCQRQQFDRGEAFVDRMNAVGHCCVLLYYCGHPSGRFVCHVHGSGVEFVGSVACKSQANPCPG